MKPQYVVSKELIRQYVGVEWGTVRLVLDQEGGKSDAVTGVPHVAHTDSGTQAAAKGTGTLRGLSSWTQEAFREGHAGQVVKPAVS